MMQRIVNGSRCFAYVPNLSNYSASVGDIALRANLQEVEFQADGRCLLEAKLEGRFRILEHHLEEGTQGLHYCRMEPISDHELTGAESASANLLVSEAEALCGRLLQGTIKQKIEAYHGLPPRDREALSLWLCGVCLNNNARKMEMLSTQNTLLRLQVGVEALRSLVQRLQQYLDTVGAAGPNSGEHGDDEDEQMDHSGSDMDEGDDSEGDDGDADGRAEDGGPSSSAAP